MQIALQTFTIRKEMKENLEVALTKVRAMGYNALELSRIDLTDEVANLILKLGFKVVSIQKTIGYLTKNFDNVVAFMHKVGCELAEVSVMSTPAILFGEPALRVFIKHINALRERFEKEGIITCYHHHDFEFVRSFGKQKLDTLLTHFHPAVGIVSDTYWSKKFGYTPQGVIARIGNRLVGVHMRDHTLVSGSHKDCEVGAGDIDFAAVLESLPTSTRYVAVEQNSPTPYLSIETSLRYIQQTLQVK